MEASINAHILPALGKIEVEKLTRRRIRDWHQGLATTAPRLRTKEGKEQKYKPLSDDPETVRKRRATANKILTILKAALNHAVVEGEAIDTGEWLASLMRGRQNKTGETVNRLQARLGCGRGPLRQ